MQATMCIEASCPGACLGQQRQPAKLWVHNMLFKGGALGRSPGIGSGLGLLGQGTWACCHKGAPQGVRGEVFSSRGEAQNLACVQ